MRFPAECDRLYRPVRLLAQGGSGAVWEAEHRSLGTPAAVKVFIGAEGHEEFSTARFLDEARVTAQLNHPNIVRVLELGLAEEQPWIAYELLPGPTLRAWLQEGQKPLERVLEAGAAVAGALEHAHAQGVIHRDVKPENVLAAGAGRWKVADFGIAKWAGARVHTRTGVILGTPTYLAPESLQGLVLTTAVDVYALGVMMHEMLEGAPPFVSDQPLELMRNHLEEPAPPLSRTDVPDRVRRLVERMLSKDPAARPLAQQVRADLALVGSGRQSRALQTRPITKTTLVQPLPRRRPPVVQGVMLGALIAIGIWSALRAPPPEPPRASPEEPDARRENVEALHRRLTALSQDCERQYRTRAADAPQLEQRVATALAQALELVEGLDRHPRTELSRVRAAALLTAVQVGFLRDSGGVRPGSFERIRSLWQARGDELLSLVLQVPRAPLAAPADAAGVPAWIGALRGAADRLGTMNFGHVNFLLGQRYAEGLAPFATTGVPARDPVLATQFGHYASFRQMGIVSALAETSKIALDEAFKREPARGVEVSFTTQSGNLAEAVVRKYAHELTVLLPLRARTEQLLSTLERELPLMLSYPDLTMGDRIIYVLNMRETLRTAWRLRLDCGRVLACVRLLRGEPLWVHAQVMAWAQLYAGDAGWRRTALDASERLLAAHPPHAVQPDDVYLWSMAVRVLLDCASVQRTDELLYARASDALKALDERFRTKEKPPALGARLTAAVADLRGFERELGLIASSAAPASARPSPAPRAGR